MRAELKVRCLADIFIFNSVKKVGMVNLSGDLDTGTKPGWRQVIKEESLEHQRRKQWWPGEQKLTPLTAIMDRLFSGTGFFF